MDRSETDDLAGLVARVSALERAQGDRRVDTGYARWYGPLAVLALAITFVPLVRRVPQDPNQHPWPSPWQLLGTDRTGVAALGVALLLVLAGVLLVAAIRPPRTVVLPIAILVLAILLVVMLLAKPGTVDPEPVLTGTGVLGVGVGIVLIATAVSHIVVLAWRRTRADRG